MYIMNVPVFLDRCLSHNRINETDKKEILSLYANLKTYNYDDLFSSDIICNLSKQQTARHRTILDNKGTVYLARGTATDKSKKRIFKIWITNNEHPRTNDVCIQMLLEFYFHNIFYNNTDNSLIIPETYKCGKVLLEANNEILYFYEMDYYDSEKYILDSINNMDDEHKSRKIFDINNIIKDGCITLDKIENNILIYHNDGFAHEYVHMDEDEVVIEVSSNMMVYNDKPILIDFGSSTRNLKTEEYVELYIDLRSL